MSVEHRNPLLQQYQATAKVQTTSVTLTGNDSGKSFTNTSAPGPITVTLPKAKPGLAFVFLGDSANALVVQPLAADTIRGSAAGVSTSVATGVYLGLLCIKPGYWEITNGSGGGGGGGSNPYNVTPDTHASGIPSFLGNDEFEGATLDTTGSRFTGALAWTKRNFTGVASATLEEGALFLKGDTVISANENYITQTASVAGTWTYETKLLMLNGTVTAHNSSCGLVMGNSANGHLLKFGFYWNGVGNVPLLVQQLSSPTVVTGNPYIANSVPAKSWLSNITEWVYIRAQYDGTNLKYYISEIGYPDSFVFLYQETPGTSLGAVPNWIGLTINSDTGTSATLIAEYFRQVA
jgi:hypothetical protein